MDGHTLKHEQFAVYLGVTLDQTLVQGCMTNTVVTLKSRNCFLFVGQ